MVIEIVVLGYSRVVVARLKTESIVYILFTDFLKNVFNVLSFLFVIILLLFYSKEVEKNHLNSIQKGGRGDSKVREKNVDFQGVQ